MPTPRLHLALPALLFASLAGCGTGAPPTPDDGKPRLAVLVVFDQMRGDFPDRWRVQFGPDGFNRLRSEGAWFTACYYPYATTVTAAGHASLVSGCSPERHGIVGNSWYDRTSATEVVASASPRYLRVPPPPGAPDPKKPPSAGNPDNLLVSTVGDVIHEATHGKGKVVALSLKDRSAVLPGGKKPDACYWFDAADGKFVTSTYYRETPHEWVRAFDATGRADAWFGQAWERLRPDLDYTPLSSPDDQPGEGKGSGVGVTFPHPLRGVPPKDGSEPRPGAASREALAVSPFGNNLLLELAEKALVAEGLGKDNDPDFLSVSFSSNDLIGHAWGPDSQEVMDVTLRSDLILRDLIAVLDRQVGKGRYVLVLSADHGVCPLPEVARTRGHPEAVRLDPKVIEAAAEEHLATTFGAEGKTRYIEKVSAPWFFLNRRLLVERNIPPDDAAASLADWFRKQPGFSGAYTSAQLSKPIPEEDQIGKRMQKSYFAERCGDVGVVTAPYALYSTYATGTSHGTPHDYDRHVPLAVFGAGVQAGERADPVTPQAAAAILTAGLGLAAPAKAEATVPAGLFAEK